MGEALLISGSILIVSITLFYLWLRAEKKIKAMEKQKEK